MQGIDVINNMCLKSNKTLVGGFRILVICLGLWLCADPVYAQLSSAELQRQRAQLDRDIARIRESLKTTTTSRTVSLNQVNALSTQLRLREQKINTISQQIRVLNNRINAHNREISTLRGQLERLRKDYENMVLFAFRNRNAHNKMMFIFAAKDFNQAFKRVKYLQQLNDSRKDRAQEIEKTQKELALLLAQLEVSKREQAELLQEQQAEKQTIAEERGEESKVLSSLTKQEKQFQQELTKRQQEQARLTREINRAIDRELAEQRKRDEEARLAAAKAEAARTGKTLEEIEAARPAVKRTDSELFAATPEAVKLSANFAGNKGNLPWPVRNGIVTTHFGNTVIGGVSNPVQGIRIRTGANSPVTAVFAGDVSLVTTLPGLGQVVMIRHGKFMTVYANVKSVAVKRGDAVGVGQQIGLAITDADGVTEVYFELIDERDRQNPEHWLAK